MLNSGIIYMEILGGSIMTIENDTKTISQSVDEEIQNIISRKLDQIEYLDEFIKRWVDKGRDISQIEWDIAERELRIKDLKAYCRENGKDIKDYYKNE
jgi:hypothetical protein